MEDINCSAFSVFSTNVQKASPHPALIMVGKGISLPSNLFCFEIFSHFYSSPNIFRALAANKTSSSVLKYEKLKRTAPCFSVPKALCIRGAQ